MVAYIEAGSQENDSLNCVTKSYQGVLTVMLKQFIKQCLFFGSQESFHKFLGALGWGCVGLFMYAVINLVRLGLS
jgi:hypothetical protein